VDKHSLTVASLEDVIASKEAVGRAKDLASLTAIVEHALELTHFEAVLLGLPNGLQRVANVRKLTETAREFETHRFFGLGDFVRHLRETISDQRLRVVEGSAAQVDEILRRVGFLGADYIISGIPFSTIDAPLREQILRKTHDVLEPGGAFLVYQFSTRVLQDLRRVFGYVGRKFQPWNVLPAHLFICQPTAA
jgi:hypothetical protein